MPKRFSVSLVSFVAFVMLSGAMAGGSSFTPLEWQKVVLQTQVGCLRGTAQAHHVDS